MRVQAVKLARRYCNKSWQRLSGKQKVNKMNEHIERMKEEEKELSVKIAKLGEFIHSEVFYSLPEREQWLLDEQLHPMNQYRQVLKRRIAMASGWIKEPKKNEHKGCKAAGNSRY